MSLTQRFTSLIRRHANKIKAKDTILAAALANAADHMEELQAAKNALSWRKMYLAPKNEDAILVLLEGSDNPLSVRRKGKKWVTTWDSYELSDADGPRCWMPIPGGAA